MDCCTIKYFLPKIVGDEVAWTGEIKWPGGGRTHIYFNFTCPDAPAFIPRIRPFLLAFLVPAMRLGHPLQLEQPLDQTTLHNLMEWQCAIASWFPNQLKVVPIRCPIEPEPPKIPAAQGRALTAFSGGVDSCFTAYRHSVANDTGLYRHTQLGAGLMVHGFDIPEAQAEIFHSAFQRSTQVLNSLGLQAYSLRTNLRSLEGIFGCDWEYETHGIWLAAALACFEPYFDQMLIPASYSYPPMILPWGSNPVTDVYFGSEATPLWHDGAAYHKLEKVQAIASHPGIQRGIRVCWQGAELDRNCGLCIKCITTQVCYWLSGVPSPEGFARPCTLRDVAGVMIDKDWNRYLFQKFRDEAARQQATDLTRALATALRRNTRQRLQRKLKQLCLHPRTFLNDL